MNHPLRNSNPQQPSQPMAFQGFTLVEMLIAGAISAVMMGLIANLAVHQIRISDNYYTTATLNRRFNLFSTLLRAEFRDACRLRGGSNPSGTNCTPATADCGDLVANTSNPASGSDLRLMIPVFDSATNTITYPIVRYYTSGTNLLRNGPAVNADGSLSTAAPPYTDQLIMNNVSTFAVTVTPDCSTATFSNLTLTVPGTTRTQSVDPFSHYIGKPSQL